MATEMPVQWTRDAECHGLSRAESDRLFYGRGPVKIEARVMCAMCPVSAICREEGDLLEGQAPADLVHGFRAGESAVERIKRRRAERAAS